MSIRLIAKQAFVEEQKDPPSMTLHYLADGEADRSIVTAYAEANTEPALTGQYGFLYRQNVRVAERAHLQYDVDVTYGERNKNTGEFSLSFDTTGGTLTIKASRETKGKYAIEGETAPDFGGAIGVHGTSPLEVDGTDVVIPALKLTATFRHPTGQISLEKIKQLARVTGKVAQGRFLSFDEGEVLFLGCSGNEGSNSETSIAYQFACSENIQNQIINGIKIVKKRGWDVAWIYFQDSVTDGKPLAKPKYIYVEQVYDLANLRQILGFG